MAESNAEKLIAWKLVDSKTSRSNADSATPLKQDGWDYYVKEGTGSVGLVLIHEIFGRTKYIENVANDLAKNGFWVVAPDIYRGKIPSSFEEAARIRQSISKDEILDSIGKGRDLLIEKMTRSSRIGTMGFCMGGGFALFGASHHKLDFCIDYYGMMEKADDVEELNGPIIAFLGGDDERINTRIFQELLPATMKYKKRIDLHMYPKAKHAFHRPQGDSYNPTAAKDAWKKTIQFLSEL